MADPEEITVEDCVSALELIAEADADLIPYILTYYPPEKMLHISSELCQRLEQQRKLLYPQE